MAEGSEKVFQMRPDLTPEKIQQFMSALSNHGSDGKHCLDLDSPPPTDDELQQFLDYMEAGVLNEDRLEYEERRRREQDQPNKRCNKTASMYFYRPRYLSMIQEEDDGDHHNNNNSNNGRISQASGCTTPRNSVASSIYESLNEGDEKDWSREARGGSPEAVSTDADTLQEPNQSETVTRDSVNRESVNRRRKSRPSTADSTGSELSLDSLASINSILSDESSLRSYSSISRRSIEMCERGEALSHILRQLPPPPRGPPSATPPLIIRGTPSATPPPPPAAKEEQQSCDAAIIQSSQIKVAETSLEEDKLSLENNNTIELTRKDKDVSVDVKDVIESVDKRTSRSLFERQLNDIMESTVSQKKRQKVDNNSTSTKGGRLRKLFCKKSEVAAADKNDVDKIKSEPSSPSTMCRFFRRSSFQKSLPKMSKSRSETSLATNVNNDKSPKLFDRIASPKIRLKRSKSLNDGQSNGPKVVVEKSTKKSTNPFENDEDDYDVMASPEKKSNEPVYQSINDKNEDDKNIVDKNEIERLFGGIVERRSVCSECENGRQCFDCRTKQSGRVVSVYENLDNFENNNRQNCFEKPKLRKVTISELIAECEDYVKTEQFTRDLSSQILNMFLQERSNHSSNNNLNNNNNSNNPFEENSEVDAFTTPTTSSHHYDVPSHVVSAQELSDKLTDKMSDKMSESKFFRPKNQISVSEQSFPKFPFVHMDSRDSIYENGEQTVSTHQSASHEESPVDSAYGSDMKPEFDDLRTLDLPNNSTDQIRSFPDLPGGSDLTRTFSKLSSEEVRSPSSCSDLSSVSTIKRADDSVNYDSVISEYESAMSDIEETMSHLSRRSRSLTPTLFAGGAHTNPAPFNGFDSWDPEFMYQNDQTDRNDRIIDSNFLTLPPPKTRVSQNYNNNSNNNWGFTSLDRNGKLADKRQREDRQIGSIAAVFDELKDYLSDSDLSLDYKIALRRRKNRSERAKWSTNQEIDTRNQFWGSGQSRHPAAIEYSGGVDSTTTTTTTTPMIGERSDSRQRMREYAESVLSLNQSSSRSRSGSEESSRSQGGFSSSYSAPSTPVGPRRGLDSRYRRSPSVTSEISCLLEPIPEEDLAPAIICNNNNNKEDSGITGRKLELIRHAKAAARQEFFKDLMIPKSVPEACTTPTTALLRISGENLSQTRKLLVSGKNNSPEKTFGKILNGNSSDPDRSELCSTLPRSDSNESAPDYGSLKRRKSLRSASLGSLLQNRDESGCDESVTIMTSQNSAPLVPIRSGESSGPLTFTSSVKVEYKTTLPMIQHEACNFYQNENKISSKEPNSGIYWARQWNCNDEEDEEVRPLYGQQQFSRQATNESTTAATTTTTATEEESGPVMVKQCSCGQKITFDPINESWPLTRSQSTSSVSRRNRNEPDVRPRNNVVDGYSTDSDVSYFRSNTSGDNVYFAYPVVLDDDGLSPPRPPPPENYDLPPAWSYYSLPRKIPVTSSSDVYSLRKSASTSLVSNSREKQPVFQTPFDRFMTSQNRQFDFQKVAG